ncbi:hypothetical protein [Sphingobacterium mizutaii]|uniref:hypothetical protein n=1 Tax=Sphingobacterium mizutaii TaxID=1010 RepID=UPI00289A9740|nr:hypothetical protein [Sphingobacterium mizutaii]
MKTKFTLIIIFSFFANYLIGQIVLLDSISNDPIPAVSVFDSNGTLINISDKNGHVQLKKEKLHSIENLTFQHLSYRSKEISLKSILSFEKIIKLTPSTISIDEIEINNNSKDWLVLRGYYRVLETFDGKNKYFSDGIVQFFIPLTDKKEKKRHILEDYRVFGNDKTIRAFKEVMGPFSELPRIANIDSNPIHSSLSNEYELKKESKLVNIYKHGNKVGEIGFSPNGEAQTYIDLVQPDSMIKKKIFRVEGIRTSQVRIETYDANNLSEISLEHLKGWYSNNIGSIKRKRKLGYFPYETLSEFYVLERFFLTSLEVQEKKNLFNKSIYLEEKSDYSMEFWKELDQFGIPPLPSGITKQFGKQLMEF